MMGTNNCLVLGEVGVGEEGDQACSGTHPGLPLNQSPPNQVRDQPLHQRLLELLNEKGNNVRIDWLWERELLMGTT